MPTAAQHPSSPIADLIAAARREAAHAPADLAGVGIRIECLARLAVAQHQVQSARSVMLEEDGVSTTQGDRR